MSQLVVALDVETAQEAERLIDELYDLDVIFKVGLEGLYGYGDRVLHYCEARDVRVFVDAKLHDIPRTAAAGARALVRPGVHILNVHAGGGAAMMRAVVDATAERAAQLGIGAPHVLAVTILTSIGADDFDELGFTGSLHASAMRLAALARDAGCAGVVCSPLETRDVKAALGDAFLALTPGVRPAGDAFGDQKRVTTPAQAVADGSDYLVVGRPIVRAADPYAATLAILREMATVCA